MWQRVCIIKSLLAMPGVQGSFEVISKQSVMLLLQTLSLARLAGLRMMRAVRNVNDRLSLLQTGD